MDTIIIRYEDNGSVHYAGKEYVESLIHLLNLLLDSPSPLSPHAPGDIHPLYILRYSGLPIFLVVFYLRSVIFPDLLPDATPSSSPSRLLCQSIINPLFHQFSVASYACP